MLNYLSKLTLLGGFLLLTAKKFGVTEFLNPKDHDKPIQEVHSFTFYHKLLTSKYKCVLYTDGEFFCD